MVVHRACFCLRMFVLIEVSPSCVLVVTVCRTVLNGVHEGSKLVGGVSFGLAVACLVDAC